MYKLKVITSTTRPGRKGIAVANWIHTFAAGQDKFEIELLDLAVINLPFMDEPQHPRLQQYEHEHTKKWSAVINEADAFIFVSAEYNFGFTAPLKNALDYLYNEWGNKPVAFVSYGGIAAGTRSVQMMKQVVTALRMVPVVEAVNIPFFTKYINDNEEFVADETLEKSASAMLAELLRWTSQLKQMR